MEVPPQTFKSLPHIYMDPSKVPRDQESLSSVVLMRDNILDKSTELGPSDKSAPFIGDGVIRVLDICPTAYLCTCS